MQRGKHTMDDLDKGASLLEATPVTLELKLQLQEEIERERDAVGLSARRAFACRVVAAGFIILFVVLFCFKAFSESADQRRSFSSSCMHAIGGGFVGPRGNLLHFDPRCTEELKEYFDQAYYAEVRRVSDTAIAYFRQQIARNQQQVAAGTAALGGSRGIVIFDIDETALSNMDGFFGDSPWSRLLGHGAPDRCVRPHLEYDNLEPLRLQLVSRSGQLVPVQPQRRPLCNSPPLRATLDLYNFLYDNNFTVVFLTGRSEDARSETEANLADAGYGRKCSMVPAAAGATASSPDAAYAVASTGGYSGKRHSRRQALQYSFKARSSDDSDLAVAAETVEREYDVHSKDADRVSDDSGLAIDAVTAATSNAADSSLTDFATGGVTPGTASSAVFGDSPTVSTSPSPSSSSFSSSLPFASLFSPPAAPPARCYSTLIMRAVGDVRLASVFKAEARARLLEEGGDVLVGNIGDQFSDLVGQAAAAANFKLPNPVYTLL